MPTASAATSFSRMEVRLRPYLEWIKRQAMKKARMAQMTLKSMLE